MKKIIKCACCQSELENHRRTGIIEIVCERYGCGAINTVNLKTGEQSYVKPERKNRSYTSRVTSSGCRL